MIPIEVKPFIDETISSWIIRTSIANGSDPSSWAAGVWPDWRIWTRDIDRAFPKEKAYALSKITSLSYNDIINMTLEPFILDIEGTEVLNMNSKWKWVIPTGERSSTKVNGLHFCPKCLSEPVPYMKKQWRFSWNTACAKHGCLLMLHCPACNEAFSPNKIDYANTDFTLCTHCGFDLKRTSTSVASSSIINIQEKLNIIAFNGNVSENPFTFKAENISDFFTSFRMILLFFRRLHNFENHQKIILEKLGLLTEEDSFAYERGKYFDSLSTQERIASLAQAICFLHYPTTEMISILKGSDISQQMFTGELLSRTGFINYILENLENRGRTYPKRVGVHKVIKPKSKKEVLARMEAIKEFIC